MNLIKKVVCKLFGHKWLKENNIMPSNYSEVTIITTTHSCKRCGEKYTEHHVMNSKCNVWS